MFAMGDISDFTTNGTCEEPFCCWKPKGAVGVIGVGNLIGVVYSTIRESCTRGLAHEPNNASSFQQHFLGILELLLYSVVSFP